MQIRHLINIGSFFLLLICLALLYCFYILKQHSDRLRTFEHQYHEMVLLGDELRQSSDDLTRFARSYVVTGDKKYLNNYYQVLAIRNGTMARPINYHIYWDLQQPIRDKLHPEGKKQAFKDLVYSLPFTTEELQKLKQSEQNSNLLTNIEIQAFHAMDGVYMDKQGLYTLHAKPNQALAVSLLYSEDYLQAKHNIMLPIDEFLSEFSNRHQLLLGKEEKEVEKHFYWELYLLLISFFAIVIFLFLVYRRMIKPIKYLTRVMKLFQDGKVNVQEYRHRHDDEFGFLARQFWSMKHKMDDDFEQIKKLSLIDPLTHIANRRAFFELAEQQIKLAEREQGNMVLMIIDIDYFKRVNDQYGHLVGDEVLCHVVKQIKKQLRGSDILARFGGEEFVLLLPNTDFKGGITLAKNICQRIKNKACKLPKVLSTEVKDVSVTVSIGVAQFRAKETLTNLLSNADQALYEAKHQGRNQVCTNEILITPQIS